MVCDVLGYRVVFVVSSLRRVIMSLRKKSRDSEENHKWDCCIWCIPLASIHGPES